MHPITSDRLAYSLSGRQSESSFPERHVWTESEEVAHESHNVAYIQPGFPKLDFGPGVSAFWQQNWLDQNQPIHRHHIPAVNRITSPQDHHHSHDLFTSSPIRGPPQYEQEWEILRATTLPAPDFPWLPPPQQHSPKIKVEDDSDSNWSLNDNSSEDLQLPQLIRPQIQGLRRRAGAGASRVSKVARQPPTPTYQHTFRMSKAPIETIDLSGAGPSAGESPEDFAAKMLERRIAHKLSEKSRRNRLTTAIREIQKLMPLEQAGELTGAGAGEAAAGLYPHFSKVDVAEMAIGYIRKLQKENQELKKGKETHDHAEDGEEVEQCVKP